MDVVSDYGLQTLLLLLQACERLCCWPDKRLQTRLVRLPKSSGGRRLVVLIHTIVRIWARLRRPISRRWEREHQNPDFWGARPAAASSDSAFALSLQAEVARYTRQNSADRHVQVFRDD
eukprot:7185440-Pyramimonas_sp.AAC.1